MTHPHPVLDALALPPLERIVDERFRDALGLAPPTQYGLACRDVAAACADAEERGGGPFVSAKVAAPAWTEHGERRRCRLDFALGYCDGAQVEYLGPGRGTDFYAEVLDGDAPVLHHVGIYQRGIDAIEERLHAAGYPTVVAGGVRLGWLGAFEFKYFDTRDALGIYLEILDFRAFGGRPIDMRPLIERGAAARAWARHR